MAADAIRVRVGELDTSKVGQLISLDVSRYTTGKTQYQARYGASLGSWSCSIKNGIPPTAPQAFPTALAFTASAVTQPATGTADLTGVDTLVYTNDVAGSGIVDVYFIGKADN